MINTVKTPISETPAPLLPRAAASSRAPAADMAAHDRPSITRTIRDDQICVLTFDRPDSAANVFDLKTLTELSDQLEFVAGRSDLNGLILTTAKKSIFVAGADLKTMSEASPDDVVAMIDLGQAVMNRLAALPIAKIAAIHGAALGGGYELCLACDYRIASDDRSTRIGLPEIQLGLIPAWGGSTRLPRLVGLPAALDMILAGKTFSGKQAFKRGLVDEVVPTEYLLDVAVRRIEKALAPRKMSLGKRLVRTRLASAAIASKLRPQLVRKTRGNYPAVLAALDVMTRGASIPVPEALKLERDAILQLVQSEACRNLVRVFFLQERARKLGTPAEPAPPRVKPVERTAVIGSGVMGAGIAQWLSARGCSVILRDVNAAQVAKGMASIHRVYQEGARRHAFTPEEARSGMDRISPAPAEVPLRQVEIVIEAAVEKLELKRKIFQRLDELAGDTALLATNTSALPVSDLAAGSRHPERVLGLHFFNPVHRMQLVEIVAARQTAPEVLDRAVRFVQQIGKLPVVVKDSPGFLVNRILMPYLLEAANLYASGASVTELDEAMLDFGMPMGPMALLDEVGIDVALHVADTLAAHFKDRMKVPASLRKMAEAGFLGRKSGSGFYLHTGKKSRPNPELSNIIQPETRLPHLATRSDLASRMVLLMVNEAARCLEERIVSDPADVDFAMIMGTGFAPFRGGPLRYADSTGIARLVGSMERLAEAGADHFQPCWLLRTMAAGGKKFYDAGMVAEMEAPPKTQPAPLAAKAVAAAGNADVHAGSGHSRNGSSAPAEKPSAPEPVRAAEDPATVIDTSKMSDGQRAALELTEAARETTQQQSFVSGLFMGAFQPPSRFPAQTEEDRDQGDAFLQKLGKLLYEEVDPDEIDQTGEIPTAIVEKLARLGAFGIKIPTKYGGLGLSQTNYCRAAMLLGGYCGNLTALLSAHQSIGVPQPLILFGTDEQKRKYLPRVAAGEISAFALTESGAGSDPATLLTRADPTPDGKAFILNGEKLWCTNGTRAGVIVVMAKTPAKIVRGKSKDQVTAFIVETDWPGVEVTHRCRFMGLKALYNGVIRFTNVRVPRENILLAEGKGLRVALTTLNTGRLTLPAACLGLAKQCVEITRAWAAERTQWGQPIGKHAAIADKLARMAANTFAMESMTLLAASLVDRDKHADVRLEAAMCKMWGTEQAWEIVNDAVQVRGGRGYETADSLRERGEAAIPLERFLRDCRINTIFEGSSEIMRLFIAREALDPHLKAAGAALNSRLPLSQRLRGGVSAALFYAKWYPKQWLPSELFRAAPAKMPRPLRRHLHFAARSSRKLARSLFHAMLRHGPKLEREQLLLSRFVEIGTELFAMTATCLRAAQLMDSSELAANRAETLELADYFCRASRLRVAEKFRATRRNADRAGYRVARHVLERTAKLNSTTDRHR